MSGSQLPVERFDANARDALGDPVLRGALRRATDLFGERRRAAIDDVGADDFEALRDHARAIKDATLAHLDVHLERFVAQAEARGAKVHWARTGDEACELLAGLCAGAGAKTVVKSKSMTTEEIELGAALEAHGLRSIETDLGEWIIQQAGEVPSHIIVPAIHKTKAQIAALFADKLGTDPEADEKALTAAARDVLRREFAAAEVGISGVNFAVAETGSILILENEGNARFTTSLPKVHIAVMGIEKVVPRFEDLAVFLKLLPRSGTGQHLTSYQSILTGPKQDPSADGPEELHIVVLDNGRSRFLDQAVTRASLACIRCGACLNACPVYQQVGGHAYGSVYPGPIGAVITPQLVGVGKASQLPYASSLCGACREVCPVRIDIPALLLHLRQEVTEGHEPSGSPFGAQRRPAKRGERLGFRLWSFGVRGRLRYEWGSALARFGQRLVVRGGYVGKVGALLSRLAPPLGAWTGTRDLRGLAPRSFRARWRQELRHQELRRQGLTPSGGER